jgi:hypothetical protein
LYFSSNAGALNLFSSTNANVVLLFASEHYTKYLLELPKFINMSKVHTIRYKEFHGACEHQVENPCSKALVHIASTAYPGRLSGVVVNVLAGPKVESLNPVKAMVF